jgi:hypothetical protein
MSDGQIWFQISLTSWIAMTVLGCDLFADLSGPHETAMIFKVFSFGSAVILEAGSGSALK